MDRSPYLAAALQSLSAPPAAPLSPTMPSPQQMQAYARQAKAFGATNPGQSYLLHNLGQAGQNLMSAPSNAASGLMALGRSIFGAGQPDTAPY